MTTIIFFVFAFIIIGVLGFFVWLGFALKQFSNNLEEKKRQYNNYTNDIAEFAGDIFRQTTAHITAPAKLIAVYTAIRLR